jgi:hypothetical protein
MSKNSYIVEGVFVAAGTSLPSRCLVTIGKNTQTAKSSHKPRSFFFQNKKSGQKMTISGEQ